MDILYQIGYIALVFRSGGMHIFALMCVAQPLFSRLIQPSLNGMLNLFLQSRYYISTGYVAHVTNEKYQRIHALTSGSTAKVT
jgi:hypothetical protein